MGFKTAGQVLQDELSSLHRRIERVEGERERLRAAGLCGALMEESFDDRIYDLKKALERVEHLLSTKAEELSARHRTDFNSKGWN
jgi:hypothetical protein